MKVNTDKNLNPEPPILCQTTVSLGKSVTTSEASAKKMKELGTSPALGFWKYIAEETERLRPNKNNHTKKRLLLPIILT